MDKLMYKFLAFFVAVLFGCMGFFNNTFASVPPQTFYFYKDHISQIASVPQREKFNDAIRAEHVGATIPNTKQYYFTEFGSGANGSDSCFFDYGFTLSRFDYVPFVYDNGYTNNYSYVPMVGFYDTVKNIIVLSTSSDMFGSYCSGQLDFLKNNVNNSSNYDEGNVSYLRFGFNPLATGNSLFDANTRKGTLLDTNLPMYRSLAAATSFYLGTDASVVPLNQDMFVSHIVPVYDETMECPQSATFSYKNALQQSGSLIFNLSWNQSSDFPYKTEIATSINGEFYREGAFSSKDLVTPFNTDYIKIDSVDCNLTNNYEWFANIEVNNEGLLPKNGYLSNSFVPYKTVSDQCGLFTTVKHKLTHIYIYLRNIDGAKTSDWVRFDYDVQNAPNSATKVLGVVVNTSGELVQDTPTDVIKGDAVVDTIVNSGGTVIDTYSPSTAKDDLNAENFMSKLKDGFGLFGDNGIIKFFSDTFVFIPPQFFSILNAGLGICFVILAIKFARG